MHEHEVVVRAVHLHALLLLGLLLLVLVILLLLLLPLSLLLADSGPQINELTAISMRAMATGEIAHLLVWLAAAAPRAHEATPPYSLRVRGVYQDRVE